MSWAAPASPNGVLLSATVNVDQTSVNVDASALSLVVSNLTHFQLYTVSVTYCTVGGCTTGPSATQTTLKDGSCISLLFFSLPFVVYYWYSTQATFCLLLLVFFSLSLL